MENVWFDPPATETVPGTIEPFAPCVTVIISLMDAAGLLVLLAPARFAVSAWTLVEPIFAVALVPEILAVRERTTP